MAFATKRLFKAAVALIMAVTLTLGLSAQTNGRDYDKEIKELEKKAEQIKSENKNRENKISSIKNDVSQQQTYINEVNAQIGAYNDQVNAYNGLINAMIEKIENTERIIEGKEADIKETEKQIADREAEIERLDAENTDNIYKFGEIIRHSYKSADADVFSMLMESTDFYGLLISAKLLENTNEKNVEFMNSLLDAIQLQEDRIAELEREKEKLNDDKTALEDEKAAYEAEKAGLTADMEATTAEINRQYAALQELTKGKAELEQKVSELRQAINASNEEVEEINRIVAELIREKQRANNPVYGTGFIWPLDANYKKITTNFGYDAWRGGMHYGTDISGGGIGGANIYAAQSGTVIIAYNDGGYHGGYGNYVVIDHGGGVSTLYAHTQTGKVRVSVGDVVKQGDVIASVGSTGWSTGNHLHFEVRINGKAVDAMQYF